VYVADTKNNRIQKFDINGKFLGKWESFSFGTPNQKFDRPDGIKYDEFSGFIFVADRKNNKIVVFEEDGKPIYELDLLKATKGLVIKPRDVTLDETGKLFVVDKVNSKIHVFGTKSLP
jgi:tripartite motif-containing protein 71